MTPEVMKRCYEAAREFIEVSMNFKKPDDIDLEFKVLRKRCLCCRGINSTESSPYEEVVHAKTLNHIVHKHGIPQLILLVRKFVDCLHAVFEDNENPSPDHIPSYSTALKSVEKQVDQKFITRLNGSIRQFLSIDYNGINDIDPNILSDEHLIECLHYLYVMDRTYGNPVYYNRFLIGDVSPARKKRLKAINAKIVDRIEALIQPIEQEQNVFGLFGQVAINDVDRYEIA
jgi:hypothetical protein